MDSPPSPAKATIRDVYQVQLEMLAQLGAINTHLATLNGRVAAQEKCNDGQDRLLAALQEGAQATAIQLARYDERGKHQDGEIQEAKGDLKEQGRTLQEQAIQVAKIARDVALALAAVAAVAKAMGLW
jgi:hypothetical protein